MVPGRLRALVEDGRRGKKLVRAIHRKEFMGTAIPVVTGDRKTSLPELLRQYRVPGEINAAEVAELAGLGFHPGMYGQPSSDR